jgi:class 3 adenylate cyclase
MTDNVGAMERVLCPILIGRDAELSQLEDALLGANRGEGQVVLLTGDAGMGKTRLASELAEQAVRQGMTVVVGGCSEAGLVLPYLPFRQAIGNHLAASDLETVRERLGPVRRELAPLFPQLEPEGLPADLESTQGRLRLFEAMLALLRIPAQETGLLVVIEDLHWADASTRELLDYLTRRLRLARILVLGTYRRDELNRRHPLLPMIQNWRRANSVTVVGLEPLSPERVAGMVRAIFDIEEVKDDTRDFLHARTEGNPFVLEEMLKAALDRGDIFRTESGLDRKALSEMRIPANVRDTILLRVDRLTEEQIKILRAASVLGADFSYRVLVALSGQEEQAVQAAVEACVQQQLLREEAGRYRFRHALTREAVYEDMIVPQREALHSQAADILAGLGAPAVEVTFHLLAAQRGDEAVPLCLQAAAEAEAAYAHRDAIDLYLRALPFVHDPRLKAEVTCRIGADYQEVGESAQARGYLETGIPELERQGEKVLAARFRLALGRAFWGMAQADRAAAEYEQVRGDLEPEGPSQDLAVAYGLLAAQRLFNERPTEGLELARRALEIAQAAGAVGARTTAEAAIGMALSHAGRYAEGISALDKSFEEAVQLGYYVFAANHLFNGGIRRVWAGRIDEMPARLELFSKLPDDPINRVLYLTLTGHYHSAAGHAPAALESFERMMGIATDAGLEIWTARGRTHKAEALYDLDRLSEARAELPPSTAFQERQEIGSRAFVSAKLAMGEDDLVAATREAVLIFELKGSSAFVRARVGWVAVDAFVRAGDLDAARRAARLAMEEQPEDLQPWVDLVGGTLALGLGDRLAAIPALRRSAESFRSGGGKRLEWVARSALARALLQSAEHESAVGEARLLHEETTRAGSSRAARMAAELLIELGASPATIDLGPADAPPSRPAVAVEPLRTGERLVTVLFADVRGYTALTRAQAPAEMAKRIATFQRWTGDEIARHRGLVDKFAGDAVMATFNVSGASVDHALHALQAAIALQDKAATLGLPIGAGIATGAAVVGALAEGANVSVVGETTNLASRLQGQAEGDEIVLSAEAYRRVRDWIAGSGYEPVEARLELKGFNEPVIAQRLRRREDRLSGPVGKGKIRSRT